MKPCWMAAMATEETAPPQTVAGGWQPVVAVTQSGTPQKMPVAEPTQDAAASLPQTGSETPTPKRRCTVKKAGAGTGTAAAQTADPPTASTAATLPELGAARADPGYVVERLLWLCERSLGAEGYDARTALRALELLGKHWGMFNDKADAAPPDVGVLRAVLAQLQGPP